MTVNNLRAALPSGPRLMRRSVALPAVAALAAACTPNWRDGELPGSPGGSTGAVGGSTGSATGTGVTLPRLAQAPAAFLGKTVTISGEVDHTIGTTAFVLDGDGFTGGSDLLVVTRPLQNVGQSSTSADAGATLHQRDIVQVTGTVRTFDLAQARRELGVELPDALARDWAGKPAIVASFVAATPRIPGRAPGAAGNPREPDARIEPATSIGRVLENPQGYFGSRLIVSGVVDDVRGRVFTIEDRDLFLDKSLLVLGPEPPGAQPGPGARPGMRGGRLPTTPGEPQTIMPALQRGDSVQVTGTLRKFELGAGVVPKDPVGGFDGSTWERLSGRPVLVADTIRVL